MSISDDDLHRTRTGTSPRQSTMAIQFTRVHTAQPQWSFCHGTSVNFFYKQFVSAPDRRAKHRRGPAAAHPAPGLPRPQNRTYDSRVASARCDLKRLRGRWNS